MNKNILVIIPVYNPPERFYALIKEIKKYVADILVVNDGSEKLDLEAVKKDCSVIDHIKNAGKGKCLIDAFHWAMANHYQWAVTIDADYQHQPHDLPGFISLIEQDNYDIINGTRMKKKSAFPRVKYYSNKISSWMLSLLIGKKIHDAQCGFRAYRLSIFDKFFPVYHDFSIETEVLIHAVKHGFRIIEKDIDIEYYPKKERVSHFKPVRDFATISVKSLYLIIKLLFRKDRN